MGWHRGFPRLLWPDAFAITTRVTERVGWATRRRGPPTLVHPTGSGSGTGTGTVVPVKAYQLLELGVRRPHCSV